MKNPDLIGKFFIGIVENNIDPLKISRVQINIPELHTGIPVTNLPWASLISPIFRGALGTAGKLNIPRKGSQLLIVFDNGENYSPIIIGELVSSSSNRSALGDGNYPNVYGFVDENGTEFNVDIITKILTVNHQGFKLVIDSSGNTTSTSPTWTHNGNFVLNGNQNTSGHTTINNGITTTNGGNLSGGVQLN